MTIPIIIFICILILIAYVFDITGSKTKIPSVILLIGLGFVVKTIANSLHQELPDLSSILPILGTTGLILIVLEGSLELEINRKKADVIIKAVLIAIIPLLTISLGLAYFLNSFYGISFKMALANSIPLGIISSAIAIPSSRNLPNLQKEFVTYESSLSDISGVLFFNFITLNDNIGSTTVGIFTLELLIMLAISFLATLGLAFLLNKIKHPIKFIPMIVLVVLIYAISKAFHLPALIFILLFGLFIGNIDELRNFKFIQKFHPVEFAQNVHKFREITGELAFLIRALFFILFGFLIHSSDVINTNTLYLAMGITVAIFLTRWVAFKLFKVNPNPLVYIAPRGLITILLFLSIPAHLQIAAIDRSLIIQIILFTALVMMMGIMKYKPVKS